MSSDKGSSVRDDIFSKAVRAGKRTYFFDVKSTRGNDLYLVMTESKRHFNDDGKPSYEKHKIFLYKEDFEKFADGLEESLDKIRELQAGDNKYIDPAEEEHNRSERENDSKEYTDVSFDDLEGK
jgi:hypothetical protein